VLVAGIVLLVCQVRLLAGMRSMLLIYVNITRLSLVEVLVTHKLTYRSSNFLKEDIIWKTKISRMIS